MTVGLMQGIQYYLVRQSPASIDELIQGFAAFRLYRTFFAEHGATLQHNMIRPQDIVTGQYGGALDNISQFPHITGIVIAEEFFNHVTG